MSKIILSKIATKKEKILLLSLIFLLTLNLKALAENENVDLPREQLLEEQLDINSLNLEKLETKVNSLEENLKFKFFGTLAFRNCSMSKNIISEPSNIIKNLVGNVFQNRVSFGINGSPFENVNYQLRFITGSGKTYNQSWESFNIDGFNKTSFNLDRLFISYKLRDLINNDLNLSIGKSINVFPETELLFDEDVSFSGLNQGYVINSFNNSFFKNISLDFTENFLNVSGTFNNSFLLGAKCSAEITPFENSELKFGSSYSSFIGDNLEFMDSYSQGYIGDLSLKNRKVDKKFESKYNLLDLFLKLNYKINNFDISTQIDFVNNLGAIDKNKGFCLGVNLGKLKNQGDFIFNYNYKLLEQDYNLSFLVSEQMGGTGVQGNQFDFAYKILPKTSLSLTLQNRMSLQNPNLPNLYILYTGIRQDI